MHPFIFYVCLKNLLKPFFSRQKPLKTFFFRHKNLLEKPFFVCRSLGSLLKVTFQKLLKSISKKTHNFKIVYFRPFSCSLHSSDRLCRYVLCRVCCQTSTATVCEYHGNQNAAGQTFRVNTFQNKPTKIDLRSAYLYGILLSYCNTFKSL